MSDNPYNMDSSSFDADKYLNKLLKDSSLQEIMDAEASIVKNVKNLHSDMQTLVYENYNKFISATDTIRKMKTDFNEMENEMNLLAAKMSSISTISETITGTLQDTRSQLNRLSGKHSLLKRLQFLSSLPTNLKKLIDEENYAQAITDYNYALNFLQQYGSQPSFKGIQEDIDSIIGGLKAKLKSDFQTTTTAQSLTEIGELLLQLGEKPSELAKDMLQSATRRLNEQIVMLQDQTSYPMDIDFIEFIDLGIDGFLQDLTLFVSAYHDMFLTGSKHLEQEADDFTDRARDDLNVFVTKNMEKYLNLVQDRVEAETGQGDSQILLRALDRLHRRLTAMKNLCKDVDMTKTGLEIIINAAMQLCNSHLRNLKSHFSDALSSVRLALVATKSDVNNSSNSGNQVNLSELITNLYVATVEKVKGVLQDLLVFMQPDWSFNLKSNYKGSLCVEGIRENLLVGFLHHIGATMTAFTNLNSSAPPNLLLVLSKTCSNMEKSGVHMLLSMADDLYEIDSESSPILTHETELCAEMREAAQCLLDAYVQAQALNISQMLRKSVETRDWLNCLEPRSVRAVMKRVVEELGAIELVLNGLYDDQRNRTSASSDSSRKTHFSLAGVSRQYRSNWSNYTPSQLESSFVSNIHRLFSERVEIFGSVEFSKVSILTGIIKISLKTLLECVRLRTFSKFGLQQIQVDAHYLQMNLWRFLQDENLIHFQLDEILGSAVIRCMEPILMEPNAVEIICERG